MSLNLSLNRIAAREAYLKRLRSRPVVTVVEVPRCHAGTELSALLSRFGISSDEKGCKCKSRAAAMDRNGCDWCEANIDQIVGWLRESAAERGLPFVDMAGKLLVRRAIQNARRKEAARAQEKVRAEGPAAS